MIRIAVYVLLVLAPLTACAEGQEVKVNSPAQLQVDTLTAKLTKGEIGRVELLQIPGRILTRARISPAMLEKQFHYKLTIRDLRGGSYEQQLIEAAKTIVVRAETEMPDLRWAVIFYGLDDSRLESLYFDKTGSKGGVGDTPVSFSGSFFRWLEKFSDCFR